MEVQKQKRKARSPKSMEYASPYEEWIQVIKPYYLTIGDVIKMNPKEAVTLICLPSAAALAAKQQDGNVKIVKDKIYDAEKFTKLFDLRRKFRKGTAPKGLTLSGLYQNRQITLQVRGKQNRQLDEGFSEIDEESEIYPPTGAKWYELNRRGSYAGLDGCHLVDASNLFKLPKVFLPNRDDVANSQQDDGENE